MSGFLADSYENYSGTDKVCRHTLSQIQCNFTYFQIGTQEGSLHSNKILGNIPIHENAVSCTNSKFALLVPSHRYNYNWWLKKQLGTFYDILVANFTVQYNNSFGGHG
jgi:hypothetical protein